MNNSKKIAEIIQTKFHEERPDFIISVGGVSEDDPWGGPLKYVVAVTDKDRIYKITVEAL